MKRFSCFIVAATAFWLALTGPALAGVPSALHHMVSPPSCEPVSESDRDKLMMNNGVWIFRDGETGFARLYCPVSFYGNVGQFENIQLWYIDEFDEHPPYGFAHTGYVYAELNQRDRLAPGFVTLAFADRNAGPLGHNYVNWEIAGGPTSGHSFFVEVQMFRESSTAHVGFVGFVINIQ